MIFKNWARKRREQDERAVLTALDVLRPEYATPLFIGRVAFLPTNRVRAALSRLEHDWMVTAQFIPEEPDLRTRRRVYRRVESGPRAPVQ